ncbi:MAG: hypothetical protein NXI20_17870 [bacterium]|nr:hypothetical protein [bacterium]
MTPVEYNIPNTSGEVLYLGDTMDEVTFTGVTVDSVTLDLTGYTITMKIRKGHKTGAEIKSLTSASDAGITITDASSGNFKINKLDIDSEFPAGGEYYYDIQFTDGTDTWTYFYGIITITQDVTY